MAEVIGEDKLSFKLHETSTHSMWLGATIAMFLGNTIVFLIMLIGSWKSDSFLKYIRKQLLETRKGISNRMLKNDLYHVLPSPSSSINDPRIRNRDAFTSNLSLIALTSSLLQAMHPSFSLYH